jgi:RecB family exonuclease
MDATNPLLPADFLQLVAGDLIERFGTDLSGLTVVFPGVRAGLFLNQYLYRQAQVALWAPQYRSIESLFESASPLRKGDSIRLVALLYDTYIEVYNRHNALPSTETMDEFFFFGETLLNDFDDVDKNRVDAQALFSNLKDLDALRDNFSHLSPEQRDAVDRHFHAFQGDSTLKIAFRNIWNLLGEVYARFRERLLEQRIAYPGLLMRSVIDAGNDGDDGDAFPAKHYALVGFNVLSRCEEDLFRRLQPRASFYWDYDVAYLDTEAGRFIRHNIRRFGSALDAGHFDRFRSMPKKITLLASPSESGQSAVVAPWIESLQKDPAFTRPDTAIVLCNEALLPVVMHALPTDCVENVNITMGFPMMQTAVASFLQALVEMQTRGYRAADGAYRYRYVLPVLRHPYTTVLFPEAGEVAEEIEQNHLFYPTLAHLRHAALFAPAPDALHMAHYLSECLQQVGRYYEQAATDTYNGLYQESVFRAYQVVNRLYGLLAAGPLRIEKPTFARLLRKLLSTVQIPFHGEPVKGLQIMGVLETRALDFDNLLMLNVNEGFLPGATADNTFLPQFLRIHFGMSTIEHQDSLYAYYFYRLIQRARRITLVYNTDKTQTGRAEMSRFLLQLLVDPALRGSIERFSLQSTIHPHRPQARTVDKDARVLQLLRHRYDLGLRPDAAPLSPSALNTYIGCSYRFYLAYVCGLKPRETTIDELDPSAFGSIFHRAAEQLYRNLIGRRPLPFTVQAADLDDYAQHPHRIQALVLKAFEDEYFKGRAVAEADFNGEQLLNFQVICKLIEWLVHFDRRRAPFILLGLEHPLACEWTLDHRSIRLRIGGIIDRLEEKDGALHILDYKTGGPSRDARSMEELFEPKADRPAHLLQTFLYAAALLDERGFASPVIPELLYIRQAARPDYRPLVRCNRQPVTDFRELYTEFRQRLTEQIDELFDPAVPFRQTSVGKSCEYCDFRELCGR